MRTKNSDINIAKNVLNNINSFSYRKHLYLIPVRKNIYDSTCIYVLRLNDHEKRDKQKKQYQRTHAWIYMYDPDIAKALKLSLNEFKDCLRSLGFKSEYGQPQMFLKSCPDNEKEIINAIYRYARETCSNPYRE